MDTSSRHLSHLLLILALALPGCESQTEEPAPNPTASPVRGGTLHVAQISPMSLDPGFVDDRYEERDQRCEAISKLVDEFPSFTQAKAATLA